MKKTFFLLMIVLFVLTSCSSSSLNLKSGLIGVIYTDALKDDSQFVTFDKYGEKYSEATIKEMGIFQVEQNDDGDIILPVQFSDSIVTITPSGEINSTKTLEFPLFVQEKDGLKLSTYNTHLDYGTLEIEDGEKLQQIKLDGYLRIATFDSNYIYLFATIIEKEQPVLYIIDRDGFQLKKEISLEIDLANDLKNVGNMLLIGSTEGHRNIAIVNKKNWKVNYMELPFGSPEYFIEKGNNIIITHHGQSNITIIDKNNLKVVTTKNIIAPIHKVDYDENNYYFLSQGDNIENAGIISVYNSDNWDLVNKIELPVIRETLVQDIKILKY